MNPIDGLNGLASNFFKAEGIPDAHLAVLINSFRDVILSYNLDQLAGEDDQPLKNKLKVISASALNAGAVGDSAVLEQKLLVFAKKELIKRLRRANEEIQLMIDLLRNN